MTDNQKALDAYKIWRRTVQFKDEVKSSELALINAEGAIISALTAQPVTDDEVREAIAEFPPTKRVNGVRRDGSMACYEWVHKHAHALIRVATAPKNCDAPEWQPIETAPKDGTEVDLWCEDQGGFRITNARLVDGNWCTYQYLEEDYLGFGWWPISSHPTYWRKSPLRPNGVKIEGGA